MSDEGSVLVINDGVVSGVENVTGSVDMAHDLCDNHNVTGGQGKDFGN